MNYIGSKLTLLPFLEKVVREVAPEIINAEQKTFCDLFAGTGAVGRHFKKLGFQIIANDLQYYAYVLNKAYLEINETPHFRGLRRAYRNEIAAHYSLNGSPIEQPLTFINELPGIEGFITKNYSPIGGRKYYTVDNANRADAIRQQIEEWRSRFC